MMDLVVGMADWLPSGAYTGAGIENYLHEVLSEPGRTDSFSELACELYLTATDLDTCERVVFGAGDTDDVAISTAVRASGALPMVYSPVKINDRELIDGGMRSTTNLDIAVEAGAKLIVVINPIVPYINDFSAPSGRVRGTRPRRVSDMGFPQIGYQAFKMVAHQRLHELAPGWEQRYPGVDIVLIEPQETDELMFQTSMMSFASRVEIARHGFESVTRHLVGEYDRYRRSQSATGSTSRPSGFAGWSSTSTPGRRSARWRKILEGTTSLCCARPATAAERMPTLVRARCRARRAGAPTLPAPCTATRMWRGSPSAEPAATRMPARARRPASSSPWTAGCAAHRKLAWLSLSSKPRARIAAVSRSRSSADRRARGLDRLRAAVQRLERAGLGDLRDAEVGFELREQLHRARSADHVSHAQAGQAPGL